MKQSKRIKKESLKGITHQHKDILGHPFGSKHPIDAKHKNPTTQKYHDMTVGK